MDPIVARKTWRTVEPIHGMIYFAPEQAERYGAVGITDLQMGYFASRAAAMGRVESDVVVATFFNFCPDLVRRSIPAAWELASPAVLVEARLELADVALRRVLGDDLDSAQLAEAADLARTAALAACEQPEGRPLFAAHARLPWPDDPHLVLWWAQTLLREFRGDGHIAAMTSDGVTAVEALVVHAATGEVPEDFLRASRGWPDDAWQAGVVRLQDRGWLVPGEPLTLSDAGRQHRQSIEDRTDALSLRAYEALGEEGCDRLRALARPWSKQIVSGGSFPAR